MTCESEARCVGTPLQPDEAKPLRQPLAPLYKYLYIAVMKLLKFISSSEDDLAEFPKEAKGATGHELWQVQLGLMPSDWKPMLNVGAGVYEIRIHVLGEWRVIYVAKFADAVYVLHAFQKKTQQIRKEDIALASARYKQLKESAK